MWNVAAFSGEAWLELSVTSLDNQAYSSESLLLAVRARPELNDSRLSDYLAQEVEYPGARQEAIELWSTLAATESLEFDWASPYKIEALDEALALTPRASDSTGSPLTLAWHDRTAVVFPIRDENQRFIIEYLPSLRDEQRVERLRHRHATDEHALETIFEWRGYFGNQSAVIDFWTTMRRSGRGFVASARGTSGFVVGTVLRRLTLKQPTLDRDPTRQRRLVGLLERFPWIDRGCPDLASAPAQTHARAMVFVHGLVSCGVQGLKDLCPNGVPDPIYRYEHDTFRPIDENARELADLIGSRLDTPQLAIVGHSRGGLVARAAATRLSSTYPGTIQIHTFGTPHLGTPLAAIGGRLLNVLFKLGEDFAGAIPVLFPLTRAYGYLWDSPSLPPGIDALREDSPSLGMLNTIGDRCPVRAWAGDFDVHSTESGFGVGIEGLLAGALSDRAHDLVVPTASALAGGVAEPLLNCSHVHYFREPAVRAALRGFFAPSTPAARGVRAISVDDDFDARIEDRGAFLIIGGVRVSKRTTE